jgi:signal transduction histidine kinase
VASLPPPVADGALALALTAVDVASLVPYRAQLHPFWAAVLLVAAQTLPLAVRRRWPVATFVAAGLPRSIYDRLGLGFAPLPLGPALAFFTVTERSRPAARRVVGALLVTGMVISQLEPGHNQPYDATVAGLIFLTTWLAGVASRIRRAYTEEVEARAARAEAERDANSARAALRERTEIARELHDVVAHHVSLMAVQAEAAASLLPGRPTEAARSVEVIAGTARQALTELRRLLGVLRGPGDGPQTAPPVSMAGLEAVLGQVRAAGLVVDYQVHGTAVRLAPGTDLTAFRIIQEALTNVIKHAPVTRASVEVRYEPGFVTVRVTDAGPGEPAGNGRRGGATAPAGTARPPAGSGFGLAGIAERVASCGGTLTVGPAGAGFGVTARLPAP